MMSTMAPRVGGRRSRLSLALMVGGVLGAAAMVGLTEACGSDRRSPGGEIGGSPARTPAIPAAARADRVHRYVSPTGEDRGDGRRSHPWRTLTHAASRVRAGVTVHVAPGHYAGQLVLARGGTARRPVRFVSERRWQARIRAAAAGAIAGGESRRGHA